MSARKPRILFVHDSFPAQFGALAQFLLRAGWDVTFATQAIGARAPGLRLLPYSPHRAPAPQAHPLAQAMDRAAINGQGFARAALRLRQTGYRPDIIVAHTGWGAGLFAKDVFPNAAFVSYCEWWYRFPGADVVYLASLLGWPVTPSVDAPMQERARNAPIALDLSSADAALCPTQFQADQFPRTLRGALSIQHDGIDTGYYAPSSAVRGSTLNGLVAEDALLVSYATRGMEPHRGFPQFMAALPRILAANPKAVAVIAGENRVAYGGDAIRQTDWKAKALEDNAIDPARVRFVGRLRRTDYLRLLQRSDAHVYLTVPFVLSWSMLEAMGTGCAMVLSDTTPVLEFADADSAMLVDLGSSVAIAQAVLDTLEDKGEATRRGARARQLVQETLSTDVLFPRKTALFASLTR